MHTLLHVLAAIATVIHAAQSMGVDTQIDGDAADVVIKAAIAVVRLANLIAREGGRRPVAAPRTDLHAISKKATATRRWIYR